MRYIGSFWSLIRGLSWSPPILFLFFICALILTVKTGFIQLRAPAQLCKVFKERKKNKPGDKGKSLSPMEALSAALAGTVGTGNIAGVSLALVTGGAGAILWLWVSAFLGMATKYAEIRLSIRYRVRLPDGSFRGGPMYYIEGSLGRRWRPLAFCFAFFGAAASFGIGNLAQCREIADAAKGIFSLSPALCGFILTALTVYIISGGAKRMGQISSFLVPVMSLLYLLACICIIALKIEKLPHAFERIISQAFSPRSALGAASGYSMMLAMRQGFARGIFSNEAGLGSSPMAHAASDCGRAEDQALLGVFEVFVSSLVFCTLTALALILSGFPGSDSVLSSGGEIAAAAFDSVLPYGTGSFIIRLSLLFFAFSSLVSWSYYGSCCVDFLFGGRQIAGLVYRFLFSLCCTFAALIPAQLSWEISDALNGLMALPNLIALILIAHNKRESLC